VGKLTEGVVAALRATFTREELPPSPASVEPEPPRLLARLFRPEPLSPAPEPGPGGSRPAGRGTLSRLLAPDPFPPDLPPAPGRAGHWLAWLFSPERLEP